MDYSRAKVIDINVLDGGYGYIKKVRDIKSFRNVFGTIRRYAKQEFKHFIHGEKIPLDRRTVALDIHEAYLHPKLLNRFDAVISSNVVEHSPNPIFFLLNCYFVTKKTVINITPFPIINILMICTENRRHSITLLKTLKIKLDLTILRT